MNQSLVATMSPDVVIDRLLVDGGVAAVAREDLLTGGTKQRAIIPYLQQFMSEGATAFVYASPAPGFAQVALAHSTGLLGVECFLFCETHAGNFHEYALLAETYGAKIRACASLDDAEREAAEFTSEDPLKIKLPLGFGSPDYISHLQRALTLEWTHVVEELGGEPRALWLPVGSGTLATTFREILSSSVTVHCVDVRVLDVNDSRIRRLAATQGVVMHRSEQMFMEAANVSPPVPSNAYYDAKLWPLVKVQANHGDLWWNVAR
ncbi:hypothetical protein GCM10011609_85190 [Lentzea pudingi]|uniref:Tryptophan synthase beta chain-like PALP domain-containing protein n=2 Tax=Lentzea pudingi TaxID=1789439 RepID=A0ABQ2IVP4_9PSEU|nr:hypothetical protein GCM10011609_85190 [Lentzea pudingi]